MARELPSCGRLHRLPGRCRYILTGYDFEPAPGFRVRFSRAGHILGAVSVRVEAAGHSVLFSGDLGRADDEVMQPPAPPPASDWVVVESTYGDRPHGRVDPAQELAGVIQRTAARGGIVLIPSFAVGRTQELVYALHELWRHTQIPEIPVYLDSPLALDATQVFRMHPEVFDRKDRLAGRTTRLVDFPRVHSVRDVAEATRR